MLKYYIPAAMLLIPFAGYSQSRHRSHFRVEGVAVKTDVLSLFTSAINKGSKNYYLSGEIYFNNEYSFNVDLGAETETQPGWKRTGRRFGSHFRWYFKQDDATVQPSLREVISALSISASLLIKISRIIKQSATTNLL